MELLYLQERRGTPFVQVLASLIFPVSRPLKLMGSAVLQRGAILRLSRIVDFRLARGLDVFAAPLAASCCPAIAADDPHGRLDATSSQAVESRKARGTPNAKSRL